MSLSDFCDLVWLELWDDCPAMGDQTKYREAVVTIFVDGEEPEYEQDPSKPPDPSRPIPQKALDALAEIKKRVTAQENESD